MKVMVIALSLIVSTISLASLYAASLSAPLTNQADLKVPQDGSIVINSSRASKPQP
jgi:hypothetical protein